MNDIEEKIWNLLQKFKYDIPLTGKEHRDIHACIKKTNNKALASEYQRIKNLNNKENNDGSSE